MSQIETQQEIPTSTGNQLSFGIVLRFFFPLAISWLFMSIEMPIANRIIGSLPKAETALAAMLVMMGISLWVEASVVDLLTTSTTLAKSRQNYLQLRRFTIWLIIFVTVLHTLVAATPVYWFVTKQLLHTPDDVAVAARTALIIMIPWSGAIGWRRYLQGLLIRNSETKLIGIGTVMRITTMILTGVLCFLYAPALSSVEKVACALVSAVCIESIFIHFISRPIVRRAYIYNNDDKAPPLTMRKLFTFHLPLTATTAMVFIALPITSAALALSPEGKLAMAGWQLATSLAFMHRAVVYALPEVVIRLYQDESNSRVLWRFCITTGLFMSGLMLILAITGGDRVFFYRVLGAPLENSQVAHIAFLFSCMLPFIGALQAYFRGMLTSHHMTIARFTAVIFAMATLILMLMIGVQMRWPGVFNAAVSLTTAVCVELGVLAYSWMLGLRKMQISAQ